MNVGGSVNIDNTLNVGNNVNIGSTTTSERGFKSSGTKGVEISVEGSSLIFNVVGIGSTSFTLA